MGGTDDNQSMHVVPRISMYHMMSGLHRSKEDS